MSDAHAIMEIQQRMESARVYLRDNSDKVGEAVDVLNEILAKIVIPTYGA